MVKDPSANAGDLRHMNLIPREDPLEKGRATHSSVHAWRIAWTEEPDGPLSTEMEKVGYN